MNAPLPLVGIVVLNYNGRQCLARCLRSLELLGYPSFFVVVVDNASQDDSLFQAKRQFPQYTFLSNAKNKGFAGGMNVGLRAVFDRGADWVWILNNDAWVEVSTLTRLLEAAGCFPRAGLLSPVIIDPQTKKLWFGKGRLERFRMRAIHTLPSTQETRQVAYESEFLTGCALLIKKEVFQRVGVLDERFFLYYEDADFSLRARAAGFQVLVAPQARVWHSEQSEHNPKKLYFLVLSGLLFFQKHQNAWQKPYFWLYGKIRRIKNILDMMRGRDEAREVRRAYDDFDHDY